MRILGVSVEGVGRFSRSARIEGFHDGVNILVAPNEAGKSTLFRALRACLFEKHSSKNAFISSLQTEGSSLPVSVTVEFEHQGATYRLSKSFLRSTSARLYQDGREIARDRVADEKVLELLGLSAGNGRGAVDDAAFGLLWVGQGESFEVPELSDAASSVLGAAIQAEVGNVIGSERARSILTALKGELSRLATDGGKPKAGGPWADAEQRKRQVDEELAGIETRLAALDHQFTQLTALRQERALLSNPEDIAREQQELDETQRALQVAESAAGILARCEADEREARVLCERERQKLQQFNERAARIDEARVKLKAIAEREAPLAEQDIAARTMIRDAGARLQQIEAEQGSLDQQERRLRAMAELLARVESRDMLSQRHRQIEDLARRQAENAAALKANPVTAAAFATLEQYERDLGILRARIEAVAPRISVTLGAAGQGRVRLNGAVVAADTARPVTEILTLQVGDAEPDDIAAFTISPASDARQAEQCQAIERKLAALLADHQMASAADMRTARARRQELEIAAKSLEAEASGLGLGRETAPAAAARLAAELAEIDREMAERLAAWGLEQLPSRQEVEGSLKELQDRRDALRAERAPLEGTIAARNQLLAELADQRGRLQGSRSEIEGRLATDLALLPDDDRARLIAEAEQACSRADDLYRERMAALEAQRRTAPSPEELERLKIRVTRLRQAQDNRKARLGALERDIANLEGQIQSAGGDGIGERLAELRERRELIAREVERHRLRARTLQLLRDTINESYKAQRDRLYAPLQRHLRPLINDVFPAGELELGDGFSVSALRRAEPLAGDFDRLSAGTQEQIAVLVRLAMGSLIAERGQQVPIVLDDALVFSDDDRIERMFDALSRAGQRQQVIILTCRTRTFARLGGYPLSIREDGN